MEENELSSNKPSGFADPAPAVVELHDGCIIDANNQLINTDTVLCVYEHDRSDGISQKIPLSSVRRIVLPGSNEYDELLTQCDNRREDSHTVDHAPLGDGSNGKRNSAVDRGDGIETDGGAPECECGADLLNGELIECRGATADLRDPCPVPVPDVVCSECGASVGAMFGTVTAAAIWDARGEPLPGDVDRGAGIEADGGRDETDQNHSQTSDDGDEPFIPDDAGDDGMSDDVVDRIIEERREDPIVEGEDSDSDGEYGEVRNGDGVIVARAIDGLKAIADPYDGRFECVMCSSRSETEHGAKVHFGREHDASDVPDDDDGNDGSDSGVEGVGESATAWDDDEVKYDSDSEGGSDGDGVTWGYVRDVYEEASVQSAPASKSDARDAAVEALENETEWMSIRERSEATKTYDLQRWDADGGWQADGATFAVETLAEELGSKATDTECKHIISQLARLNAVDQDSINGGDFDETFVPVANGVICIDDIEYYEKRVTVDIEYETTIEYDAATDSVDVDVGVDATETVDEKVIDWDSIELRHKEPEYKFLYQIETEWDTDGADVIGLDEWLESIVHSEEARRLIWEFGGHSLHPRYPADGFLTALGPGGSGKSQTLEVIKAMLGGDNVAVQSLQAIQTGRFTGQTVVDKRANINTELSGKKVPALNKLKIYSAGEEDQVEGKGTAFYKATNDATMLFASDDPPALPSDNRAVGRRLYPIEFECRYVDDPDPSNPYELQARPKRKVQEELQAGERLQAALMRSVEGLVRLLNEGDFSSSDTWQERVERYEAYADPIKDFARVCLTADDDASVETGDLKATFDSFAVDRDHAGRSIQRIRNVLDEMPTIPLSKSRTRTFTPGDSRDTVYRGIAFTKKAKEHWVPDSAHWSAYGGRPGEDEGEEIDVKTLEDIRAEGAGRYDGVKVEVSSTEDEPAPWLHDQGVVKDDTETLRYEVQSGISLDEGETYVLRDVIATKDESDVKLQLVDGMTDATQIKTREDDDQSPATTDKARGDVAVHDKEDENDGEGEGEGMVQEDRIRKVTEIIEEVDGDSGDGAPLEDIVDRAIDAGMSRDKVEHEIEKLKHAGKVYEPETGNLRVT